MKGLRDQSMRIKNDRMRWKNELEDGDKGVSG